MPGRRSTKYRKRGSCKTMSFSISKGSAEFVDAYASKMGVSKSQLVEDAIVAYRKPVEGNVA